MDADRAAGRRRDIAFGAAIVVVGGAFLHQTWRIRKTPFDVLGAAFFPRAVAIALIALGGLVVLGAMIGRRTRDSEITMFTAPGSGAGGGRGLAAAMLVLTVAYAAILGTGRVDFFLATAVFLGLSGFVLSGGGRAAALRAAIAGPAVAGVVALLFKTILGVDLP